jgi:hypothetical protein
MKTLSILSAVAAIFAVVVLSQPRARAQAPGVNIITDAYVSALVETGTATLVSGSCTVVDPTLKANAKIFFTPLTSAITAPIVGVIVSGSNASWTATSGSASGAFSYLIINR